MSYSDEKRRKTEGPKSRPPGMERDLEMVFACFDELHGFAANEKKSQNSARVYDFSIRWGVMLSGRLKRLEYHYHFGEPTGTDKGRYHKLTDDLESTFPLAKQIGVVKPAPYTAENRESRSRHETGYSKVGAATARQRISRDFDLFVATKRSPVYIFRINCSNRISRYFKQFSIGVSRRGTGLSLRTSMLHRREASKRTVLAQAVLVIGPSGISETDPVLSRYTPFGLFSSANAKSSLGGVFCG